MEDLAREQYNEIINQEYREAREEERYDNPKD